jgi:hypothetical protein
MADMFRVVTITFVLCALIRACLGAPAWVVSANGRYSVDLSATVEDKLLVAVFDQTGDVKKMAWSRAIEWQLEYRVVGQVDSVKAVVTNDGAKVVLRDFRNAKNGVKIVARGSEQVASLDPFADATLTAAPPATTTSYGARFRGDLRMHMAYWNIPALLDFMLDENHYAIWFGQSHRWFLVSLDTGTGERVKEERRLSELNRIAHAKAEELVLDDWPTPLRNLIGLARDQAAKLVSSLRRPQRFWMSSETRTAYLFIGARRDASDRRYIERLAVAPYHALPHMRDDQLAFWFCNSERALGDYLLSRWDGKTNQDVRARENELLLPFDYLDRLGAVTVKLNLPVPLGPKPGVLWCFLRPGRLALIVERRR